MRSFVASLLIVASGAAFADGNTNDNINDTVTYNIYITQPPQPAIPTIPGAPLPPPGTPGVPATPGVSAPRQSMGIIQKLTIASIDATNQNYTVNMSIFLPDGSQKDSSNTVPVTTVQPRALVLDLVKNCAAAGGTPERLTVDGGDFDTCSIPNDRGGKTWFGDVPFNIVKQTMVDDQTKNLVSVEVALYAFGK